MRDVVVDGVNVRARVTDGSVALPAVLSRLDDAGVGLQQVDDRSGIALGIHALAWLAAAHGD